MTYAIEESIKNVVENDGVGVVVYFRKEGRALGEVTKYLVYNKRKRQETGDCSEKYFDCTCQVAGIEDSRFQEFMPDILVWLGITKIDYLVSMSNMKYDAIVNSGIQVLNRITIPKDRIPTDAHVEIDAKIKSGYFS